MAKRKSKADSLIPYILGAGVVVFFLSKNVFAATPKPTPSNVQTATVGDRVYSVARLGQGNYMVSLLSTGGVIEREPVNFAFSQTEQLGSTGSSAKLAQLKSDMRSFNVDFTT